MWRWLTFLAGFAALPSATARATPWEVAFEGNDMPESEPGWDRAYAHGGAVRYIETDPDDPNNHFLVINTLADTRIYDYAYYPHSVAPAGPLERFYLEWRLLIFEHYGYEEQGVGVAADNFNIVGFYYGYDDIYCSVDGWTMPFQPGVFHTWRFESGDMVTWTLSLDGELARTGPFFEGLPDIPGVWFGDGTQGGADARSLVKWDYLRAGVSVPEPSTILYGALIACLVGKRR